MRRGDLAIASVSGDFGKPRPVLIIQSDDFDQTSSLTMLLVTSDLEDAPLMRVTLEPTSLNGLRGTSQVMIERTMTLRRDKFSEPIGRLTEDEMVTVERLLALFLGFA